MKIAVSSIAWQPSDDESIAAALRECGADAVELAPTAYWADPLLASQEERTRKRREWESRGLPIVAIQSLLYGFPSLNLFDPTTRGFMRDRLVGMLDVARDLGALALVFGSPRNRSRGSLHPDAADDIGVPFFRELGERAEERGVCLCIEPNPPVYGCDYVTTAAEGRVLVARVASPGFGLHLDTAGMLLAGEDPAAAVAASKGLFRHFHISAPHLGPVVQGGAVDYEAVVGELVRGGYGGYASIEMRATSTAGGRLGAVRTALDTIRPLVPRKPVTR